MTDEDKARQLLSDAWNHFWKHCIDPTIYYEDYMEDEDLDRVIAIADRIISAE